MPEPALLLLLPETGDTLCAAWRVVVDGQVERLDPELALDGWPGPVVGLVPAGLVPVMITQADTEATPRQSLAVARLAAQDGALDAGALAVTALEGGCVLTALFDPRRLAHWQRQVAHATGRPADVLVPAALVLPPAKVGDAHRADIAGMVLARTSQAAFAGETPLWDALVPAHTRVSDWSAAELAPRLAQAVTEPWLDLVENGGATAPWPKKRLMRLALLVAGLAMAVPLAQIARWHFGAARIEAQVVTQVGTRFPGVTDMAGAERAVRAERLRRQAGADGWAAPTAALWQALRAAPAVRLAGLSREEDGTLHFTLAAPDAAPVDTVLLALQRDGWRVAPPPAPVRDGDGIVATLAMQAP